MTFDWPIDRTGFPALPDPPGDPVSDAYKTALAERNAAENLAVQIMFALSGRQFGLRTHVVRPCREPLRREWRGFNDGPVTSYLLSWEGDRWINWSCGCIGACKLSGPNVIHLPGPVYDVTKVTIVGADLAPNLWALEGNRLYRREAPWPAQDLNRPLGDANTWSVTYREGIPVPGGVDKLTGTLAKEIMAALADGGKCRLPRNVTMTSRQGVSYRAYDPTVIYANGKTGLPEVDLWLASVNPNHLMAAPTVI